MSRIVLGVLSLVLTCALVAQTDSSQRKETTTGSCSPIVNGGSSQITISCNGLSASKANQLLVLMNRILAERLDVSDVNKKLDQLQSDLHGIHDALDPFANAPASVVSLMKTGDLLVFRCGGLVGEWYQSISQVSEKYLQQDINLGQLDSLKIEVDAQEGKKYHQTLEAELLSYRAAVLPHIPGYPSGIKYSEISSFYGLNGVCSDVSALRTAYRQQMSVSMKKANTTSTKY